MLDRNFTPLWGALYHCFRPVLLVISSYLHVHLHVHVRFRVHVQFHVYLYVNVYIYSYVRLYEKFLAFVGEISGSQ